MGFLTDAVDAGTFTARDTGPATERIVARDLVRRAVLVAPAAALVGLLLGGWQGAASVAVGLAVVAANFWASAALLAWAARISYGMVMGVALFGFLVRLALVGVAVWLLRDLSWIRHLPLGLTLVVGHLGLLFWEARSVSASLAFPALKPGPRPPRPSGPPERKTSNLAGGHRNLAATSPKESM